MNYSDQNPQIWVDRHQPTQNSLIAHAWEHFSMNVSKNMVKKNLYVLKIYSAPAPPRPPPKSIRGQAFQTENVSPVFPVTPNIALF